MDLVELARQFPDMSITVRLGDLMAANRKLLSQMRDEARREAERIAGVSDEQELIPRLVLAKRLHVDPSTLWDWARRNYLTPVKIGTKVYYRACDVDRVIEDKKIK